MTKLLTAVILAAFAFGAHAASHTGGAPMKADAPASAASGAKAHKKAAMKKDEMKGDMMKKDDMKGDAKK